jgi:hypothetical protein
VLCARALDGTVVQRLWTPLRARHRASLGRARAEVPRASRPPLGKTEKETESGCAKKSSQSLTCF